MGKGIVKKRLERFESAEFNRKKSFLLAFAISVIGSMGVGALNVAAVQVSALHGMYFAFGFSLGCTVAEIVFVRYTAILTAYFAQNKKTKQVFEWLSLIILLVLAFNCFFSGEKNISEASNILIHPNMNGFFLGTLLRILTPTMVPYWLGWKAVIIGNGIQYHAVPFALGAGVGTILMHSFYILAGQYALDLLGSNVQYLGIVVGILLLLSAALQAKRMLSDRNKHVA